MEYPRSTLELIAVAEPEADLETALGDAVADEVTMDGDVADVHTETMSLTGQRFGSKSQFHCTRVGSARAQWWPNYSHANA